MNLTTIRKCALMFPVFGLILFSRTSVAQNDPLAAPAVGQTIPDFTLSDVHLYEKSKLKPSDFNGKWLILDFWSKGCVACIQSFPKIEELQNSFKDDLRFVIVGNNSKKYNHGIEEVYDRVRERYGMKMTYAFDSLLFEQFQITSVPHIIIVNPKGVVYAITTSTDMTKDKLSDLVAGKEPAMYEKIKPQGDEEIYAMLSWPFYLKGNVGGEKDFEFRSVLGKWTNEIQHNVPIYFEQHVDSGYFGAAGASLESLYKFAYFGQHVWWVGDPLYGKVDKKIVLEIENKNLFEVDVVTGNGLYNYQLIVPEKRAEKSYMMKVMQRDLKNFFDFDVRVENRFVKCWNITIAENKKKEIKSKYDKYEWKGDWVGLEAKHISIDNLIYALDFFNPKEVFVDMTNVDFAIDISINAVMTDFNNVKEELERNGIKLERGEKEMEVLIVSDKRAISYH